MLRVLLCLNFIMGPLAFADYEEALPSKSGTSFSANTVALAKDLGSMDYATVRLQLRGKTDPQMLAQLDAAYVRMGHQGTLAQVLAKVRGADSSVVADGGIVLGVCAVAVGLAARNWAVGKINAYYEKRDIDKKLDKQFGTLSSNFLKPGKTDSCDSAMLDLKQRTSGGGSATQTAEASLPTLGNH